MKVILSAVVATCVLVSPGLAAEPAGKPVPQVVHCGLKDGKWKEYGNRLLAERDGATQIHIKTEKPCGAETK